MAASAPMIVYAGGNRRQPKPKPRTIAQSK